MTVTQLYPAIALATMVNIFVFAWAWRGHKIEQQTGQPPCWMYVGGIAYGGGMAAFLYFRHNAPLSTYLDYVLVALIGEAMGALGVYGIVNFFYLSRGLNGAERAFAFTQMVFFVGLFSVGFFV